MTLYLKLREEPPADDFTISVGDEIEVLEQDEVSYFVEIDGYAFEFTKEPDKHGFSYATWFDAVERG